MKVYELIATLMKVSAGADVIVGMTATLNADLLCTELNLTVGDCGKVTLTGGDAQLISDAGDELGLLSELAAEPAAKRKR